jgi:hypothetical protein
MNIDVARECPNDCSGNTGEHRMELGLIAGPAVPAAVFKRVQGGLINQIKTICAKLQLPFPNDLEVEYRPVVDNIFSRSEVSFYFVETMHHFNFVWLQVEAVWNLDQRQDKWQDKLHRNMRSVFDGVRAFPGVHYFSDEIYWRYYTLLHLCGTKASFSAPKHIKHLTMMSGEFYDMKTMQEMEAPLMAKIVDLKQKLQHEKPSQFACMERLITNIIKKMSIDRISAHGKKEKNVVRRKIKPHGAAVISAGME